MVTSSEASSMPRRAWVSLAVALRPTSSFLLLDPLDVLAHARVGQEQFLRIVAPAKDLLVVDQIVDAAVARPADPQAPVPHLLDHEPLAEPPLAVAMPGDEVVEGEGLARPPAQLA